MSKKPSWLFNQSGVVPFINEDNTLKFVLVTSKSKTAYIFPKGVIERFMSPEESAQKEAEEEAGVRGLIIPDIEGHYTYEKWGGLCSVKVFALEVTELLDDWDEAYKRERIIADRETCIGLLKPASVEVFESISDELLLKQQQQ